MPLPRQGSGKIISLDTDIGPEDVTYRIVEEIKAEAAGSGIETADVFVVVTQGDNRNLMAAQIAKHIFHVPKVVCRIYDPLRQELYNSLGLETISPTTIFAQILREKIVS